MIVETLERLVFLGRSSGFRIRIASTLGNLDGSIYDGKPLVLRAESA